MKKIVSLILIMVLALTFTACGDKKKSSDSGDTDSAKSTDSATTDNETASDTEEDNITAGLGEMLVPQLETPVSSQVDKEASDVTVDTDTNLTSNVAGGTISSKPNINTTKPSVTASVPTASADKPSATPNKPSTTTSNKPSTSTNTPSSTTSETPTTSKPNTTSTPTVTVNEFINNNNAVFTNNELTIRPKHVYFKNGMLYADCFVLNGRSTAVTNINVENLTFRTGSTTIATANFGFMKSGNANITIGAKQYIVWTFTFPADCIKNNSVSLKTLNCDFDIAYAYYN